MQPSEFLIYPFFMVSIFSVLFRNLQVFYLIFSFRSFIILACTIMSVIHVKWIFVFDMRQGLRFTFFQIIIWLLQYYSLKRFSFPDWMVLAPLLKISWLCKWRWSVGPSIDLFVYPYTNTVYLDCCSLIMLRPSTLFFFFAKLLWLF